MSITDIKVRLGLHFSDKPNILMLFLKVGLVPWWHVKRNKIVTRKRVLKTVKCIVEQKINYTRKFGELGGSSGHYEIEEFIELALALYDLPYDRREFIYSYFPRMKKLDKEYGYMNSSHEKEKRLKFLEEVKELINYYNTNKTDLR